MGVWTKIRMKFEPNTRVRFELNIRDYSPITYSIVTLYF